MLPSPNDLAQSSPHTISDHGGSNSPRGHESNPEVFFPGNMQRTQSEQAATQGVSFIANALKLTRQFEPPLCRESISSPFSLALHAAAIRMRSRRRSVPPTIPEP